MNKQEIIEKYKNVTLSFSSYYSNYDEYEFIYKGITDEDKELIVYIKGNTEDTYKLILSKEEKLSKLAEVLAEVIDYIAIEQEDGTYTTYD